MHAASEGRPREAGKRFEPNRNGLHVHSKLGAAGRKVSRFQRICVMTEESMEFPRGLAMSPLGAVIVADENNHRICSIAMDAQVASPHSPALASVDMRTARPWMLNSTGLVA